MHIPYTFKETYNHHLKTFTASSNHSYSMKYYLKHGKTNFQTALDQMRVYLQMQLVWLPCTHTAEYVCLQYNTALTNQEQKLHMYFAQSLLQRPKEQYECIETAGEAHSRMYSTLSVPRSSNPVLFTSSPVLFTLQFTFCLCTWVSFQSGSAKGEREGWCTPESCSDLQPAHNWTSKGHLRYVSLKEFGITNAT